MQRLNPYYRKIKGRFKVGDQVTFEFGMGKVIGTVIEDRGGIGIGGRHIYQIRVPMNSSDPMIFELPDPMIEPRAKRQIISGGDRMKQRVLFIGFDEPTFE